MQTPPRIPGSGFSRLATSVHSQFDVDVRIDRDVAIITVKGELDLATSPALERELETAAALDTSLVIVDLRELEFIDSTGLSVLVRAHQRAEESGPRLGIVNGSPQVQRLLNLTGLADKLVLAATPEELLGER